MGECLRLSHFDSKFNNEKKEILTPKRTSCYGKIGVFQ